MADGSVRFYVEARTLKGSGVAEIEFPVGHPFPRQRFVVPAGSMRKLRPAAFDVPGQKPAVDLIYVRELPRLRFELRILRVPLKAP